MDVENQWIEEYYEELYYSMGETMTEERRLEISNRELQKSNRELQKSNRELQKSTREFKYMFLKEREENGAYLTQKQIRFLNDYEED